MWRSGGAIRPGPLLVGVGVTGDERQALCLGVQVEALQDAPDAVLGDPDPAPFGAAKLGGDPPRPEPRPGEGEGDDPLLEVGADLVRHPRSAALAHVQRLQSPAVDLLSQPVVGRVVDAHRPAGRAHPDLIGQREQPPAIAGQHVIMRHLVLPLSGLIGIETRE
jgi:hypothetical protein